MSAVKQLSLTYNALNESNTFTNGDVINGQVVFEVTKEVTIESLYIKCKGDAKVSWSERHNDKHYHYSAHERYFKLKQHFMQDPSKKGKEEPGVIVSVGEIYSNVVKPGTHVYPFSFQLPHGNFPPSFKGHHGSIKYILEVTLDRSWKLDRTDATEIIFAPRLNGINLMNPQSGSIDKKMKLFTSGSTSVKATIDKMGYMNGEIIKVSTDVNNSSSRDLKLKYCLEQKQFYFAQGHSKYAHRTIFKIVGDPIPSGSKQTVNTDLKLPPNLDLSVTSCNILKVDYKLKVYLDVPYASDPEINFPVIILPAAQIFAPGQNQPAFQPYGNPAGQEWIQPPPQPAFGPSPPGAAFGPSPPGAAFGPSPPGAAFGPSPPGAPFGPSPPGAPFGPSPPGAPFGPSPPGAPFGPSPPGAAFGPSPPGAAFGPSPTGAAFGPSPTGAAFGPSPGPYPSPMGPNPQDPPPSYEALYPNPNATAPEFNPAPSAPPFNPQYAPMGYPNPPAPQQHPVASAPQLYLGPAGPGCVPAGAPPRYWPNPTIQPESYPTKSPEKHE